MAAQPTVAEGVRRVIDLLDKPSSTDLPRRVVVQELNEAATGRALDLGLSRSPFLFEKKTLRPSSQDVALNIDAVGGYFVTSRSMNDGEDAEEDDEDVIDVRLLNTATSEGRNAVAIYGDPQRIRFTRDVTDREFTVWYVPRTSALSADADRVRLPAEFAPLVWYDAAYALVHRCGKPAGWVGLKATFLREQRGSWEERFEKHLRRPRKIGAGRMRPFRRKGEALVRFGSDGLPRA